MKPGVSPARKQHRIAQLGPRAQAAVQLPLPGESEGGTVASTAPRVVVTARASWQRDCLCVFCLQSSKAPGALAPAPQEPSPAASAEANGKVCCASSAACMFPGALSSSGMPTQASVPTRDWTSCCIACQVTGTQPSVHKARGAQERLRRQLACTSHACSEVSLVKLHVLTCLLTVNSGQQKRN